MAWFLIWLLGSRELPSENEAQPVREDDEDEEDDEDDEDDEAP